MSDEPKRRGGRPTLIPGHKSQQVNIRIPEPWFDKLCALAQAQDVALQVVLRDVIARGLKVTDVSSSTSVSCF